MRTFTRQLYVKTCVIEEFFHALHRGIENRHSRPRLHEGKLRRESRRKKSGFRIKCGMTTRNRHFQLLIPRISATGYSLQPRNFRMTDFCTV